VGVGASTLGLVGPANANGRDGKGLEEKISGEEEEEER
jgi:hypothetical protein